jgi:hypothetical protein
VTVSREEPKSAPPEDAPKRDWRKSEPVAPEKRREPIGPEKAMRILGISTPSSSRRPIMSKSSRALESPESSTITEEERRMSAPDAAELISTPMDHQVENSPAISPNKRRSLFSRLLPSKRLTDEHLVSEDKKSMDLSSKRPSDSIKDEKKLSATYGDHKLPDDDSSNDRRGSADSSSKMELSEAKYTVYNKSMEDTDDIVTELKSKAPEVAQEGIPQFVRRISSLSSRSRSTSERQYLFDLKGFEDSILDCLQSGYQESERMAKVFARVAEAEKIFSKTLHAIVMEETSRLFKEDTESSATLPKVYRNFLDKLKIRADAHRKFSMEVKENIASPLSRHCEVNLPALDEFRDEIKALTDQCCEVQIRVEQHKTKCQSLIKHYLKDKEKKVSTSSKFKLRRRSKVVTAKMVFEACFAYQQSILFSNEFTSKYAPQTLDSILAQIQKSEMERIEIAKDQFKSYENLFRKMLGSEGDCTNLKSHEVSASSDMECLAKTLKLKHAPSPSSVSGLKSLRYDLSLSLEELSSRMADEHGGSTQPKKVEESKLDFSIAPPFTKSDPPDIVEDCKIPMGFFVLSARLFEVSAVQVEGIFRLNGDFSKVESCFSEFLKQNWSAVSNLGPHDAATLLKRWLRTFYSPLLEPSEYGALETLIKNTPKDLQKLEPDQFSALSSIMSSVSVHRRLMIQGLILVCREISSASNVTRSKMDSANLGLVFAPIMVTSDGESNPAKLLDLFKLGSSIVDFMIRYLDVQEFLEEKRSRRVTMG